MLLVNVSGRFIIGITNIPDVPDTPGAYDILGNSELAYIGFPDTPDVNQGIFGIQANSSLAYIGQANIQPIVGIGNYTILGNSVLAYQGSNGTQVRVGSYNILSTSVLNYIGQASQGGTIIREGEFDILGQSVLNMIGRNGAASEGPNDFFDELIARSDLYFQHSWRNQIQIDGLAGPVKGNIISSSATTPTVMRAGGQKVAIVSSTDGLITVASNVALGDAGYVIEISGHSLAALNGLQTVAQKISATSFRVDGISGNGVGGFFFIAGHALFDQQVLTIAGHTAIPNGIYVATVLDPYSFSLQNLISGTNVTGSGGGSVGTIEGRYIEYFPGSGRADPFSDPQDAAKYTIPVYYLQGGRTKLNSTFPAHGNNSLLITADQYFCPNTRTATAATTGPIKTWRHTGSGLVIEGPKVSYPQRFLKIQSTTAGNPTTIATQKRHYYTTGETVAIAGNNQIPNGSYVITVIGLTTFTIAIATGGNSGTVGTIENSREVGRLNTRGSQSNTPGWKWNTGIDAPEDWFTGQDAPPMNTYPVYQSLQNRWWSYFRPNLTGDSFTSWNASQMTTRFGSGHILGKWNFSATVDGSGVATLTCTDGPHGYDVGGTVTIAGISGVNGTYVIASVPASPTATSPSNGGLTGPTTFTITGATPSASGSGTAAYHYTMETQVWADENREPLKWINEVPLMYRNTGYSLIRLEFDSSNEEPLNSRFDSYVRNNVGLINPTSVVLANTTLFRKPIAG